MSVPEEAVTLPQEPTDTCLQCSQSRKTVKRDGTYCATVSGYEYTEIQDEWPRHHWRDWSDKELSEAGIHPSLWGQNRRTNIYNLEIAACASSCMENGHVYPDPADKFFIEGTQNYCMRCWGKRESND